MVKSRYISIYFHIIGDGHQPNSRGLYTHYKDPNYMGTIIRIPIKQPGFNGKIYPRVFWAVAFRWVLLDPGILLKVRFWISVFTTTLY